MNTSAINAIATPVYEAVATTLKPFQTDESPGSPRSLTFNQRVELACAAEAAVREKLKEYD